jgi:hypothetical protein
MAVIQRTVSVDAASVTDNILSGSAFEFIRGRSIVQMGITAEDASDVFVTIQAGPNVIAEEFNPTQANDYPAVPDGFYYAAGAVAGDRLVVRVRNADGTNAETVRIIVQITEV